METRRDVIVRTAVLADELGYEIFAVPEGWGLDSTPVLTEIALRTARIQLSSGILSVWGRTPATLAMTAATLHQISGGRYVLGLGASTRALVEGFHDTPFEHPAPKLRDVVIKVRSLLAGQPAQLDHAPAPARCALASRQPPRCPSGSPRWASTPSGWPPNSATAGSPHWWPETACPAGRVSSGAARGHRTAGANAHGGGRAHHRRRRKPQRRPRIAALHRLVPDLHEGRLRPVGVRPGLCGEVQRSSTRTRAPVPGTGPSPGAQPVLDQLTAKGTCDQVREQLQLWDGAADIVIILLPPGMPWHNIEATLRAAAPAAPPEVRLEGLSATAPGPELVRGDVR